MLKPFAVAALAMVALGTPALAAVVTPVAVTASNTFVNYDVDSLIDGSGLSGGLHDATYSNMWMTDLDVDKATLTFDLGGLFELSGIDVWNYNFGREEFASTLDRAAKAFTLSISTNGVDYTQVLAGEFARGTGAPIAAEAFNFAGTARYVQLSLDGNHAQYPEYYGYAPVGLSEVRFQGSAAPEPATWALLLGGFGATGALLRRRRASAFA